MGRVLAEQRDNVRLPLPSTRTVEEKKTTKKQKVTHYINTDSLSSTTPHHHPTVFKKEFSEKRKQGAGTHAPRKGKKGQVLTEEKRKERGNPLSLFLHPPPEKK
jgi:hypothetical protein